MAVVSLCEGDYFLGLGALVNSLYNHGFRGDVLCGFRGDLQGWTSTARERGVCRIVTPAAGLEVRFIEVAAGWHLANLKPSWMLDIMVKTEPKPEYVALFDPDIVVKTRWSFYEEWISTGVALCEEIVMGRMAEDHPLACQWKKWAETHGYNLTERELRPLNAGFVGVARSGIEFLNLWQKQMVDASREVSMEAFLPNDRSHRFYCVEQDVLNIASITYPGPISRIGPEGMDFVGGGFTMSHAAGGVKPWRKKFVKSALAGIPPTLADKGWADNLEGPIQVVSEARRKRLLRSIRVASAIGRFVRKS